MRPAKLSWLKLHITEILAIMWSVACISIFAAILFTPKKEIDDKTTYLIIGNMYGIVMLLAGYYWGSAKGMVKRSDPPDPIIQETTSNTQNPTNSL